MYCSLQLQRNDQNEENCKITEYLLKLKLDRTATHQQSYTEEVISNDNHGYMFDNLLSGEKYKIQAIAVLPSGQIEALNIYIYTKPHGM